MQDGDLLMINLSIIFVMNHLTHCSGAPKRPGSFFFVVASTMETDETETLLPLVLPHQDVISSLKAYQADSNDIE